MYAKDLAVLTKHEIHKEAEHLQKSYGDGDLAVREEVDKREKVRDGLPSERQALRIVSRRYGFHNWTKFHSYLDLDQGVREVIDAVRFGDIDKLRTLLKDHSEAANPFWVGRDHTPKPIPNDSIPLFMVCIGLVDQTNKTGNAADLVKTLIEAGADPDIEDSLPLGSAASFNLVDVAKAMLDGGAKVDGINNNGGPLARGLFFGWDVAKLLEERGARLDLRTAAGLGRVDVMPSFFNQDGTLKPEATALDQMWGKAAGFSDAEVLAQGLVNACITNQVAAVEFLLDKGVDINVIPKGFDFRATGLHRAIRRGSRDVAKLLIERGADLTIKDGRHEWHALDWAENQGRDDIADLIRQKMEIGNA